MDALIQQVLRVEYGLRLVLLVLAAGSIISFSSESSASCNVVELTRGQLTSDFTPVKSLKAGAHSFTSRCNRNQVIDDLKAEACALGANAIVITKEKKPGAWRSCFTIEATAYSRSASASAPSLELDDIQDAAATGDTNAQYLLGKSLLQKQGDKADPLEAYAWLNLAASQNHPEATKLRDGLEQELAWSELAVAQNRAYELWLEYYKLFDNLTGAYQ